MKNVVIIEDDPYVRKFYERLFRSREYEVIQASTGEEGLRLVAEHKPTLVLCDILMAPMNGMQVLDELKKNEATKMIPVVMLTNIDDHATMKLAREHGADGFMVKTYYEPEELRSHVEQILKEH